jgi:uncharacterized membrane protein YhaH (DUF805 family)
MFRYMFMPLRKYATFRGRARRAEFWWFSLFAVLLEIAAMVVDFRMGHGPFTEAALATPAGALTLAAIGPAYAGMNLFLLLPSIAVSVRRLHDINRSGWYYLLGLAPVIGSLILLFWFFKRGTSGGNDYGPDPKAY